MSRTPISTNKPNSTTTNNHTGVLSFVSAIIHRDLARCFMRPRFVGSPLNKVHSMQRLIIIHKSGRGLGQLRDSARERQEREREREEAIGSHRVYLHNHLTREQVRGVQNADFNKQTKRYNKQPTGFSALCQPSFIEILHAVSYRPLWGALLE